MPRLAAAAMLLSSALGPTGCRESTSPFADPTASGILARRVIATPTADGILISNQTDRPVYLHVIEQGAMALDDWAPFVSGAGLSPGDNSVELWASIRGYSPSAAVYVVAWWRAEIGANGSRQAGPIQYVRVTR